MRRDTRIGIENPEQLRLITVSDVDEDSRYYEAEHNRTPLLGFSGGEDGHVVVSFAPAISGFKFNLEALRGLCIAVEERIATDLRQPSWEATEEEPDHD